MNVEEVFSILKSNSQSVCDETVRILIKIADNIIQNPSNLKVRSLQKTNNTVRSKILASRGGLECLKLMGFQENDTCFVLPSNSPVSKLQEIRKSLITLKENNIEKGAISKNQGEKPMIYKTNNNQENNNDLKNVKRFVLPQFTPKFTNPLLRGIETQFHQVLALADKECQKRAKKLIPLDKLEINAQRNLRYVQSRIKKEKIQDPDFSIQDMLLVELLTWFKEEFFTWVDSPDCESCGGKTTISHMSSDPGDLAYASRIEVYKCEICKKITKFPRYTDLNILLETRRGRCGEWAQVFTFLCLSLGWDARFICDNMDHVWTEVYSATQKRWVHCDSCENACDTPLMYESGWNKKLAYVIAYSPEEVQDVTWRYTSNHKEVLSRRRDCSEQELIKGLMTLRTERQKLMSKSRRDYLTKRLVFELIELMVEKKAQDNEKQGRLSGSKEWRASRGEIKNENMFVWRIGEKQIINDKVKIKYSAALDMYEFVKGDESIIKVDQWSSGIFDFNYIFRKEEKDWKNVYLARTEGSDEATVSWRFELGSDCKKNIDFVSLKFHYQTFENGEVIVKLVSDNLYLEFPKSERNLETQAFSGVRHFTIQAILKGGKGKTAWQHAQLFRQPTDSKEFPFMVTITFK